jgi:signal transduction histidine kinase
MRGEAVDGEEVFLQPSASTEGVWLLVTGRPLRDRRGHNAGGVIVFTDITGRKALERQIAEASDREQRRLGEDLHDGLCQHLVSTAFAARNLASKLTSRSGPEAKDAGRLADLLGEAISQARNVARGLYVVSLEAGGLASALEEFALQVSSRYGLTCQFVEKSPVPVLEQSVVTSLFRIAQEAVNNASKHAQPTRITITLSADPQRVRLEIEDDGIGFRAGPGFSQPADSLPDQRRIGGSAAITATEAAKREADHEIPYGMGLRLMNYRARMVGATLDIGPRCGGGTIVTCSVQCPGITEGLNHDGRD